MNLMQKVKQFMYWRQFNITYWAIFKDPLTKIDKAVLLMMFIVAVLLCLLGYGAYKDSQLRAMHQLANKNALQALKMRQLAKSHEKAAFKNELLLISLMNGSLIENGRITTWCQLNAAGDCR